MPHRNLSNHIGRRVGLLVEGEPYIGGKWQYMGFLLEALKSVCEKYEIIVFYFAWEPRWKGVIEKYGFRGEIIGGNGRFPFYYRHVIDTMCCDLLLDGFPSNTCCIVSTPVVSIVHDLMHRYAPFPETYADYKEREKLYKGMARYSHAIFVDSAVGREHFVELYGYPSQGKIYTIPFAVPEYLSGIVDYDERRSGEYIFYPAQFWKHKNHAGLIRAAYKLREEEGIVVKLLFVGSEKNNLESIKEMISSLHMDEQVEIRGYVSESEMRKLYLSARAMMMPSFFGPTNIPPLEAMASGCPCAVSNIYAMPWQVGDAGLVFDPHSDDSIADAMKKLWLDDELCATLSKRGKERIHYFSKEMFGIRVAEAIADAIDRLPSYKRNQGRKLVNNAFLFFCCYGLGIIKKLLIKKQIGK